MTARRRSWLLCLIGGLWAFVTVSTAFAAKPSDEVAGLPRRIPWTTSRVVGSPEPPAPYEVVRVFPSVKFDQPIGMYPEPGSRRLWIFEYTGKIQLLTTEGATPKMRLMVDLALNRERRTWDSLAFHPDFERNGLVYVFSNGPQPEPRRDRISRFQTKLEEGGRVVDPKSETIILEWDSAGHDGGDLAFGPEGALYITAGDGTSSSDVNNSGQRIDDLPGSILRIDVDHPSPGKQYSIPSDNPFLKVPGARGEVWAFGLRNPWRMSYDPDSKAMFVGDVGQDTWEMIYLVQRGANYGWSRREGSHDFLKDRPLGPAPLVNPIAEHHHSEGRCITGGYVYRGQKLPELNGAYIYCDYDTGKVWGLRHTDGRVTWQQELADSAFKVGAFGLDHDRELYLIAYTGELLQLVPTSEEKKREAARQFPMKLSDTGLFESLAEHRLAPGVLPYDVNAALWSDGAYKHRYVAIPGEGKIDVTPNRGWGFTEGTVLVKSFELEMTPGDVASRRRIETRLLVKQQGEWVGYTYEWDDDQRDAVLVDKGGKDRDYTKQDGVQRWRYPSRAECMVCHSRAAQYVLGLTTLQMNRDYDYRSFPGGRVANQLQTFQHLGMFSKPLAKQPEALRPLVNPHDKTATTESRVRSYLHANCSSCHVPDGGGNARIDLEIGTDLGDMKVIGVKPTQGDFGIPEARLIAPGHPEQSVLLHRISSLPGHGRMPPLGTGVLDQSAIDLIRDWIVSLPPGWATNPPAPSKP